MSPVGRPAAAVRRADQLQEPAGRTGWLLFTELSAANGAVIRATSVLVGFAGKPQPPDVKNISWAPVLPIVNGWLKLVPGAGTETFAVWALGTDRVEFFLNPTGTATGPPANGTASSIGAATRNGDKFTLVWNYRDEPLLAHLTIAVVGPGGRVELEPFNIYHD